MPRSPAAAVVWGLVFYAAFQAGLLALMAGPRPDLSDPEYGRKLLLLRERRQEETGRRLALLLGSSRTEMGLRPGVLPAGKAEPLVFNFGLSGAGVVQELLCLRRLLADGIRPDYLFVEVIPALLQEPDELARVHTSRLLMEELPAAASYSPDPGGLQRNWWLAALAPCHAHRFCLMSHYAHAWLPWYCRQDHIWRRIDHDGWLTYPHEEVSLARRRQQVERAHSEYAPQLAQPGVSANSDRALRELLGLCRREGIPVVLFLMPEGPEFRTWYPPMTRQRLDGYLARLCEEQAVTLVDARAWVDRDDAFLDSHHLLPAEAAAFTERFHREVIRPAVAQ